MGDSVLLQLPTELTVLILQSVSWDVSSLISIRRTCLAMHEWTRSPRVVLSVDLSELFPRWRWDDEDLWFETDRFPVWRKRAGIGGRGVLPRATQIFSLFPHIVNVVIRGRFVGRDSLHKLALGLMFGKSGRVLAHQVDFAEESIPQGDKFVHAVLGLLVMPPERPSSPLAKLRLDECYLDHSEGCACCFKALNAFVRRVWCLDHDEVSALVIDLSGSSCVSLSFLAEGLDFYLKSFPRPVRIVTRHGTLERYCSSSDLSTIVPLQKTDGSIGL